MKRVEDYIEAYTRRCSNELEEGVAAMTGDRYAPWLTPEHARSVAVITREETIKEACKWLELNCDNICIKRMRGCEASNIVEAFRKEMETTV
ncbi:MAG: hypothetical protein IJ615_11320 [Bacteroidaceae bacterium]|nr:hypothetical protein [Bacteroidaceae bacterium]